MADTMPEVETANKVVEQFEKHSSKHRCCWCGAHVKAGMLIVTYAKLICLLLCLIPFVLHAVSSGWHLERHTYSAAVLGVGIASMVIAIAGAHCQQALLLLPFALLSALFSFVYLPAICLLIYDWIDKENDVVIDELKSLVAEKHEKTAFYSLLALLIVLFLIDLWLQYIVWKCFFYLNARRDAQNKLKKAAIRETAANNGQMNTASTTATAGATVEGETTIQMNGGGAVTAAGSPTANDSRPLMRQKNDYDNGGFLPGFVSKNQKRYDDDQPHHIYDRVASADSGDYSYPEIIFHPDGTVAQRQPPTRTAVVSKGYRISYNVQG